MPKGKYDYTFSQFLKKRIDKMKVAGTEFPKVVAKNSKDQEKLSNLYNLYNTSRLMRPNQKKITGYQKDKLMKMEKKGLI